MGQISMATRDELVGALATRYAASDRKERGRILDEFVAVSGLHRKHAMRLLCAGQLHQRFGSRPVRRIYSMSEVNSRFSTKWILLGNPIGRFSKSFWKTGLGPGGWNVLAHYVRDTTVCGRRSGQKEAALQAARAAFSLSQGWKSVTARG